MATCGRPDCCLEPPAGGPPVAGLLAAFAAPTAGLLGGAGVAAWAGSPGGVAALAALAGMLAASALAGAARRRAHAPDGTITPLTSEESR